MTACYRQFSDSCLKSNPCWITHIVSSFLPLQFSYHCQHLAAPWCNVKCLFLSNVIVILAPINFQYIVCAAFVLWADYSSVIMYNGRFNHISLWKSRTIYLIFIEAFDWSQYFNVKENGEIMLCLSAYRFISVAKFINQFPNNSLCKSC